MQQEHKKIVPFDSSIFMWSLCPQNFPSIVSISLIESAAVVKFGPLKLQANALFLRGDPLSSLHALFLSFLTSLKTIAGSLTTGSIFFSLFLLAYFSYISFGLLLLEFEIFFSFLFFTLVMFSLSLFHSSSRLSCLDAFFTRIFLPPFCLFLFYSHFARYDRARSPGERISWKFIKLILGVLRHVFFLLLSTHFALSSFFLCLLLLVAVLLVVAPFWMHFFKCTGCAKCAFVWIMCERVSVVAFAGFFLGSSKNFRWN